MLINYRRIELHLDAPSGGVPLGYCRRSSKSGR
jgi:hypothetical protein